MRSAVPWLLLSTGCAPGAPDTPTEPPLPAELADPFQVAPRDTHGMTDASHDLEAVLEGGALPGSCDRLRDDPGNARLERMCGKEMFFYDPLGTSGVPRPLVDFLLNRMEDQVGPGFSDFGLIPDPFSARQLPLGMAASVDDTVAFTCASCHFGRLPDGRYAVGSPNQDYEYGRHNLALTLVPMSLMGSGGIDPEAREAVAPLIDRLDNEPLLRLQLVGALVSLVGSDVPEFPPETQRLYARWAPGTMDFLIAPLPLDDGVHTVSRIPPLWGIPTEEERASAGMDHAMLGWTGNTPSTEDFVYWFGVLGGEHHPTDAEIAPLTAYLESLAPPEPPAIEVDPRGHAVFDAACAECHQGPSGSGLTLYSTDEIGTDAMLTRWMDPDATGVACCHDEVPADFVTGRIKSPRLVGLWAQQRFLHNGAVESLEQLLCLEPRAGVTEPAFSDAGHEFGCDLPETDRWALLGWLESH